MISSIRFRWFVQEECNCSSTQYESLSLVRLLELYPKFLRQAVDLATISSCREIDILKFLEDAHRWPLHVVAVQDPKKKNLVEKKMLIGGGGGTPCGNCDSRNNKPLLFYLFVEGSSQKKTSQVIHKLP